MISVVMPGKGGGAAVFITSCMNYAAAVMLQDTATTDIMVLLLSTNGSGTVASNEWIWYCCFLRMDLCTADKNRFIIDTRL